MKWSAALAVCAAPLAFASILNAENLVRRGVAIKESSKNSNNGYNSNSNNGYNSNSNNGYNNNNNNNNGGSSTTIIIEETIIIWDNVGGGAPTNTRNSVSSTAGVSIATHSVIVGGPGLTYTPNTITANIGDMVIFTFMSKNHTATQSSFAAPCVKLASGMDSGFMPNANNSVVPPPQMAIQVTVATPLWFYCRQKGHCGQGMTFSINPTSSKTQAMFEAMAIAQNGTGTTAGIVASTAGAAPVVVATSSPVAVAPPASTSTAPNNGLVSGSGTQQGEACSCSCFCGVAQFPAAVQGIAGYGGMPGAMPAGAMMTARR